MRSSVIVLASIALLASLSLHAQSAGDPVPMVAERSCGDITLTRLPNLYDGPSEVAVRLRGGAPKTLGPVFADVNAACTAYWLSAYDAKANKPMLAIVDAHGNQSEAFEGHFPRWLADSSGLVYTVGHDYELEVRNVDGGGMRRLFKPTDSTPCALMGDGDDWRPPIAIDRNTIEWTYPTTPRVDPPPDDGMKPAVTVRIDVRTGRVLSRKPATAWCDYYDPDRKKPHRKASKPAN